MAYNDNADTGEEAGEQLSAGGETDQGEVKEKGYTCFLPPEFPGADALKPGDTVQLKVVGKSADGELEVEHLSGEEPGQGDMMSDLRSHMAAADQSGGEGAMN